MIQIHLDGKDEEMFEAIKEKINAGTRTETIRHLMRIFNERKNDKR